MRIVNGHVMVTRSSALYGTWEECRNCGWELINDVWYRHFYPECPEQSAMPPECEDPEETPAFQNIKFTLETRTSKNE